MSKYIPTGEIAKKLAAVHAELEPVTRDAEGQARAARYKYATIGAVMETVRPVLTDNGLIVVHDVVTTSEIVPTSDDAGNQIHVRAWAVTVTTAIASTDGEYIETSITVPVPLDAGNIAQAIGSATTYGRRYGVMALLAMSTSDDDAQSLAERQPRKPVIPEREPREDGRDLVTHETWAELSTIGRQLSPADREELKSWQAEAFPDEPAFRLGSAAQEDVLVVLEQARHILAGVPEVDDETGEIIPGE